MRKILVIFFLLISLITYSQSGVGYLNYTSYLTHAGLGYQNQYPQFANSPADFVKMFDTANSNTTIYSQGVGTAAHTLVVDGSYAGGLVRGDMWGVKITGYFIPKETGTYLFGVNSDDGSDVSINDVVVASYYGGHGMGGYRTGQIQLTAGVPYRFMARFQQYGGGWGMMVAWKRPSQSTLALQPDEVSTKGSIPSKQAKINFDFGTTLDKTKFSAGGTLSSNGVADVTDVIDSIKVDNGYQAIITPGQVEWSLINPYETNLGGHRLQIDERVFGGTGINLNNIKSVKLFDIYEGPVNVLDFNGWWKQWTVPGSIDLASKVAASSYQNNIRLQDGWYAFKADYSFSQMLQYKPQSVTMTTTNNLTTLYSSIVTVSDVYLAFKELSNQGGLFGNSSNGGQFTYGVQYKNADVNDDGIFNESDCFALLQHLMGTKSLVDTLNLKKTLKLIPTSIYNTIGKSNWNTSSSYLGDTYNFDINTGKPVDTFYLSGTWKGDVNLSHSAIPASNGITTMSLKTMSITTPNNVEADIMMEKVGDSIVATINVNSNGNQIGATQFDLYYDNSVLNFSSVEFNNKSSTNFGKNNGTSISVGSLNTSGGSITNIGYKIIFKPKSIITNLLGLISVINVETLDVNSNKLNVKII